MTSQADQSPERTGLLSLAYHYVPILAWLPEYNRAHLMPDAFAALTVWALLVPEAMAYATIAGVPPEAGLYAAILPLFIYGIFGTSRQLSVGPSSGVAILSAATIAPLADSTEEFIALTAALAIVVGVILVVAGVARMGWVSQFMAKPVLAGFVIGLALVVLIGQADKLVGIDAEGENFWREAWDFISSLGDAHLETTVMGVGSLALLFALARFVPRAPGALITVFLGIAISAALSLEGEGVHIVGDVPSGLPPFGRPDGITLSDIQDLLPGAVGIVLVGYAESLAIAKSFATKYKYKVNPNQELIALGLSNVGAGLSQGFVVDGSLSRSATADGAGQKTQMAALINGVLVIVTVLAFTALFRDLPEAVLGAIVVHAVWHLIDFGKLRDIYNVSKADFWLAAICLLGVLTFDILAGLIIAIAVSLLVLVYRASRPGIPVLGKDPEENAYRSVERNPRNETYPGLIIFRLDGELFFANAIYFRERVEEQLAAADPPARAILIDAEAIHDLDLTAAEMLKELASELAANEIDLLFASVHQTVREMMERSGVEDAIGADHIYPAVQDGVDDFLARRHAADPASGDD
ncbi:MAG: SulP family inorganic anion transporter [Chloroflexi bacterium]|nr:SulP family inorganic anion transporter [Chloroflexota bacterium]MCI0820397.1 SulP family inorganic anion transporter [Chloroflexota bacterium]MCI0832567.1 SulP family inorganic anion transporter [Chloroflexota bacterium]MCI0839553.1 SulP family inorganic anion transporter [Chloroflexota bacterium]MCI0843072.1 SulP family inorganic anion transporter [Chloroflexota bacterium]